MKREIIAVVALSSCAALHGCGTSGNGGDANASSNTPDASDSDAGANAQDASQDAAPPPTQDVSTALAPIQLTYGGVPGLAAIVMRGNNVIAIGASGVRKLGDVTPMTTRDLFEIGQDVQAMTATLAAVLVEDGKLAWTSALGDVITDPSVNALYRITTLEDLVAQRSGAPTVIPDDVIAAARAATDPAAGRSSATSALLAMSPEAPAGTFHQSDASFLFANAMIEKSGGGSWESLVAARLYAPLDMTTCAPSILDPGPAPTVPWGHIVDDTTEIATPVAPGGTSESPAAFAPTSALRCSITDWAKFAAFHLAGARAEPTAILHPQSFLKLQTPYDITHALGWNAVSRTWAGEKLALTYESATPSSYALIWVLPDKDAIILVAINQGGAAASKVADDAVANLVGTFINPQN